MRPPFYFTPTTLDLICFPRTVPARLSCPRSGCGAFYSPGCSTHSYQTPNGVVSSIQLVPTRDTQILPLNAIPAPLPPSPEMSSYTSYRDPHNDPPSPYSSSYRESSPYRAPSPYRASLPYRAPSPDTLVKNLPPTNTGQVSPGQITYTTAIGPDGKTIYHLFRCVLPSTSCPLP